MADQILQDIKDRLDIAEVLGSYIQIKKAGVNFKAPCPFHNEKSPSLVISPSKQIWHCFGCNEGGDVFGFVMKYENVEFREALKILADRAGVSLPEYRPGEKQQAGEQEQLLKINDFAARYYHEIFLKDKRADEARAYIRKRGLTPETVAQWKIGFAPNEFHSLEDALFKKQVQVSELIKAGVSVKSEKGQVYDRFRGRITFPIFNVTGEVVGFTARVLPGAEEQAKYINSPETTIYNKSKVLFGFNFAKSAIRKLDEVIIVEGQMDCIAAHQAGFTNVVASSGTALTSLQLTQLGRFTKNFKFCFDGDAAGQAATRRSASQYIGKEFLIKIITLPDGAKDPDELIRKDPKAFERAVAAAPLFLDFYIAKIFENFDHSVEQQKQLQADILPMVGLLSDPLEKDHYIKVLADKFGTIPSVIVEALHRQPADRFKGGEVPAPAQIQHKPVVSGIEKQVLGGLLVFPSLLKQVRELGSPTDFSEGDARELATQIFAGNTDFVSNNLLAKEVVFMVESQVAEMQSNGEAVEREAFRAFSQLRLLAIKNAQKDLIRQMKIAEEKKQKDILTELNGRFAGLSKERSLIEKGI